MYNNLYSELYHYGVPGMKKGQRKWTNEDGTLNEAGKARYAKMYGNGKVGSGYTQARAAANKQRNSMNSQAALRSGGSTFTNSHKNRLNTAKSMNSQAALRMGPVSTGYAKDDKRTRANMTRRSMASQYELGSAKDRKRIENRIQNREAQERSMYSQANAQLDKARRNVEAAGTRASMRSQAATASARDRQRIKENTRKSITSTDGRLNAEKFTKKQNTIKTVRKAQAEKDRNYLSDLQKSAGRARSRNASRALQNEREDIRRMTDENNTQRMLDSINGKKEHYARKSSTKRSMNSQAALRENSNVNELRPENRNNTRQKLARRAQKNRARAAAKFR